MLKLSQRPTPTVHGFFIFFFLTFKRLLAFFFSPIIIFFFFLAIDMFFFFISGTKRSAASIKKCPHQLSEDKNVKRIVVCWDGRWWHCREEGVVTQSCSFFLFFKSGYEDAKAEINVEEKKGE